MRTLGKAVVALSSAVALNSSQAQDSVIQVQADKLLHPVSRFLGGACIEDVNHEIYGGLYSQMVFGESFQEPEKVPGLSGMWRGWSRGDAKGRFAITADRPFVGCQSQQLVFESGSGEWGVENQGLNRWGMNVVAGRPYDGIVWARADKPIRLFAALESRDGANIHAETDLSVTSNEWQQLSFTLTPNATDSAGRFVLKLKQPGNLVLGHAFLQPGEWGRFKGLPVRRDVAEGLIAQGITLLRYGGSMVNHADYRWKNMVGPRDRRTPYQGTWYPQSSNGFGIPEFMSFCEAAGFPYVPAFNMGETPQDMADFIEYANGAADSEWGRRRVADGHPQPYRLKYLELGNEERVDDKYAAKFEALAKAIWAKDENIVLVVGDFVYSEPIGDPFKLKGAASGITTLAGQQQILRLARENGREVWFDVHVGTDGPRPDATFAGMFSFVNALERIANGARFKVVVFEFNANNHTLKRALANALAINALERDGRVAIACSANCLQPDGQNDNGWDQGLLFFNPSQVWLQPPGYVTQMMARNYQPNLVECEVTGPEGVLDANAKLSDDGKTLVLQVVNPTDSKVTARTQIRGFVPARREAQALELSGNLDAVNSSGNTNAIVPLQIAWEHRVREGGANYTFPPRSFTVLRLE